MDTIACFLAVHARDLHRVPPAKLRAGADDAAAAPYRLNRRPAAVETVAGGRATGKTEP